MRFKKCVSYLILSLVFLPAISRTQEILLPELKTNGKTLEALQYTLDDLKRESFYIHESLPVLAYSELFSGQDSESGKAYQKAYNLILNEKWNEAIGAMQKVLSDYPRSRWRDDASFWIIYAQDKSGQPREAVFSSYQNFINKNRSSKWVDDAKINLIRVGKELAQSGKNEYLKMLESMEKSDQREISISALYALGRMGDDRALDSIIKIYDETDDSLIKEKVIYTLNNFKNEKALDKIISIAQSDPNPKLREKAIYWLSEQTPNAKLMNLLEEMAMKEANVEVAEQAVQRLTEFETQESLKRVMRIAREHSNKDVRARSVLNLREQSESPEVLELLETVATTDKAEKVRDRAMLSIAESATKESQDILMRLARVKNDENMRQKAVYWLGEKATSKKVLDALGDIAMQDSSQRVRERALHALAEAPEGKGLPLLEKIARSHGNQRMREKALYWFGENSKPDVVVGLCNDIIKNDPSQKMREQAVYVVSELPAQTGKPVLADIAENSTDAKLRLKAVYWLADNAHDKDTIDLLLKIALTDPEQEVQMRAVYALTELEGNAGTGALIQIAKEHKNISLRKRAIYWLGESNDPEAREALLEIINQK